MDRFSSRANPNSVNAVTPLERLSMSHFLSWSFCKPSDNDSLELVTSLLIALPFWLGDAVILMRPSDMLRPTIRVPFCEAFGSIPSSVAVQDSPSSFCFFLPTLTMHLLQNVC